MVNKRNVIYVFLSLGCLIASYYINGQANQKMYVNNKFVAEEIQSSYGSRTTIEYNNAVKEGEEELVERCLQILDSLQANRYADYEGFGDEIRDQILPIADSLGIIISPYQSNVSAINTILNSLVICRNRKNNDGLRLIISDFVKLGNDSIKLVIWPFREELNYNIEFLDSSRVLSIKETSNFQGTMTNIEVRISDSITLESKVIKYKRI